MSRVRVVRARSTSTVAVVTKKNKQKKRGGVVKLSELEEGAAITFEVHVDEKKFEFPSVVKFQKRGKMYFEPIRVGDKLLNVSNEKISVNLVYAVEGDKPILWRDLDVQEEVYKRVVYYCAKTDAVGKVFNRRGAYRQFVGAPVFAKVGTRKAEIQVILRDISTNGFSFVYREDIEDADHSLVVVPYVYRDEHVMFDLTLSGKIVRKQVMPDGKILYGCVLVKKNELIAKFVNYKQKEQLIRMNHIAQYSDESEKNM